MEGQQESEVIGPTAHKELNPTKTHMTLEGASSPVKWSNETSALAGILIAALWKTLEAEDPAKMCWDSWPNKLSNKCVSFYVAKFL